MEKKDAVTRINRRVVRAIVLSFIAGVLWLAAMRFVTLRDNEVHYHANFALFVDGERHAFNRFTFYEEIQSCGGEELMNPKTRTHMHENVSHVVHVHDAAATWGHFFANLGMTNGDTVFRTDTATYVEDDETSIRFVLNGEEVDTTANRTIKSEDALLISIDTDGVLDTPPEDPISLYNTIKRDAGVYNQKNDPASCTGGKPLTTSERLKKAVGIFGE